MNTPRTQQSRQEVRHIGQVPHVLAAAHLLATTPLLAERASFVLLNTPLERSQFVHALQLLLKSADTVGHEPLQMVEWNGDRFLLGRLTGVRVCIADRETITDTHLPAPSAFERRSLFLSPDSVCTLQRLKEWLGSEGYERDTTVQSSGTWATRGNVLDVFLDRAYRLTIEDDVIERIVAFDWSTGRELEEVNALVVPSLTQSGRSTLIDYIPSDARIISVGGGVINGTLNDQVLLEPLSYAQDNAGYVTAKAYHLRMDEIAADARAAQTVLGFSGDVKRMQGLFRELGIRASVHPFTGAVPGFLHTTSHTLVLTDASVGFAEEKKRTQSRRVQHALLQELKRGDYVVHLYHGVARYAGTQVMHVNERDREYLILEYANNDKIYVPVELADRVDKYLGGEHPQLQKLADASWHEVVARAKAQTVEVARELLELYARRTVSHAPLMSAQNDEGALNDACPFALTTDQEQALRDIFSDMSEEQPMDRLLCGDVGFGKTEVALRAAYRAVLNGFQVAVLAPTTILTQQHTDTFVERLSDFGVRVASLSRFATAAQQGVVLRGLRDGSIDVVIGTHRLLSNDVSFKRLGLIVVDEEQRFGVKAKERLKRLRHNAHVLTMTATPIPRTMHLSLAGVRDISTILTPPLERRAVITHIAPLNTEQIRDAITAEMKRGGQTYYVHNRVQSIEHTAAELAELVPTARIGIAHGQLPPKELARVMHLFDTGELDVLLATTIIENGLDIPTANTLIVEHASMLGLAELYQLKGRVGRAGRQGYAYFFYKEQELDGVAKERLVALAEAEALGSGFELAMKDMEIRGIGNMLGKEQHGHTIRIGVNLYVRLLNQAVQQLQGVEQRVLRDIPIDLPLDARIPDDILGNEAERVMLYQRLAMIESVDELEQQRTAFLSNNTFSRGGVLDPSLNGLFDLLHIKCLASQSSLLSIDTAYPSEQFPLPSPRITLTAERLDVLLPQPWEVVRSKTSGTVKMRATLDALGDDWVRQVAEVIILISGTMNDDAGANTNTD